MEPLDLNIVTALATIATAIATYFAANAARDSAEATRKAATVPLIVAIRGLEISDANTWLSNYVREHKGDFINKFINTSEVDRLEAKKHIRSVKEPFIFVAASVDLGVIKINEIKKTSVVSDTTADILLGIVESLSRVIDKNYDPRPFKTAATIFNKGHFPATFKLFDDPNPVEIKYPEDWSVSNT